jgi:hypothetical protein
MIMMMNMLTVELLEYARAVGIDPSHYGLESGCIRLNVAPRSQ